MAFLFFKLEQTDFKKKRFTKYFHLVFSMCVELLVYVFIHEHTYTNLKVPFSSIGGGVGIPGATTCTFQIPGDYVVH